MAAERRCLIWGEGSVGQGCLGAATRRRPVLPLPGRGLTLERRTT
jgi:hypothetical protein